MFEFLIVTLLIVVVIMMFSVIHTLASISHLLVQISTNPIRHHVDVTSEARDASKTLGNIDLNVSVIFDELKSLRRHFVPDDDRPYS